VVLQIQVQMIDLLVLQIIKIQMIDLLVVLQIQIQMIDLLVVLQIQIQIIDLLVVLQIQVQIIDLLVVLQIQIQIIDLLVVLQIIQIQIIGVVDFFNLYHKHLYYNCKGIFLINLQLAILFLTDQLNLYAYISTPLSNASFNFSEYILSLI